VDNRSEPSTAPFCGVSNCPHRVASYAAPLCEPHMIEAWRWVEARPSIRPIMQVTDMAHPRYVTAPEEDHVVYYLRLGSGDIKIGVTTSLERRVRSLRLRYPDAVMAWEPGGYVLEKQRHAEFTEERRPRHFSTGRVHEDFEPSVRLLRHIESLCALHGGPSVRPPESRDELRLT
jgi:hypothetical protein